MIQGAERRKPVKPNLLWIKTIGNQGDALGGDAMGLNAKGHGWGQSDGCVGKPVGSTCCAAVEKRDSRVITARRTGKDITVTHHQQAYIATETESDRRSEGMTVTDDRGTVSPRQFTGRGKQRLEDPEQLTGKVPEAMQAREARNVQNMNLQPTAKSVPLLTPLNTQAIADQADRMGETQSKGLLPGDVGYRTGETEALTQDDNAHADEKSSKQKIDHTMRKRAPKVMRGS
jgi:hypothetical protein